MSDKRNLKETIRLGKSIGIKPLLLLNIAFIVKSLIGRLSFPHLLW